MIFINDLPSAVNNTTVMMYADDTTLYHSCVDIGDLQQALSADLQSLAAWLKWNKLKINVQKTQLLLFERRSRAWELKHVRICLNGTEICCQDQVKYLGVKIDRQLTWKQHISFYQAEVFSSPVTDKQAQEVTILETEEAAISIIGVASFGLLLCGMA